MLGLPVIAEYVFCPNKTPPKLILFVVAIGNEIFVPIIILFEPKVPNTVALPTLYPNKFECLLLHSHLNLTPTLCHPQVTVYHKLNTFHIK